MQKQSAEDNRRSKPTFEEFYEECRFWLPVQLFRRMEDKGLTEAEAEEVANEVCIEIYQRYAEIEHPKTYTYQSAVRKVYRYLDSQKKERERSRCYMLQLEEERGLSHSVERALRAAEENGLSKREILFYEMHKLEGKTLKEIGELWGYSHGYMRKYSHQLAKKTRKLMDQPHWEGHTDKKDMLHGLSR